MKNLEEKYYEVQNTRVIKARFFSSSNGSAKVKITDNYLKERKQTVTLSYDYEVGNVAQQAFKFLVERGFNVVARASNDTGYLFMVDNWNEDYLTLKGEKYV